ncbi:hypothetical protein ACSAZK_03590 [Methanosarcina sp. Mfa9]|uniref:hypothetical protein n=1 Tax=Methanosarcina sp. Mfa9 TaxID=3439063 RepID=UPI003F867249
MKVNVEQVENPAAGDSPLAIGGSSASKAPTICLACLSGSWSLHRWNPLHSGLKAASL